MPRYSAASLLGHTNNAATQVLVSHKYIEAECKKMFNTNPKVNPAKLQDAADKFAEKEYNRLKAVRMTLLL